MTIPHTGVVSELSRTLTGMPLSPQLRVALRDQGGCPVLALVGVIDIATAPILRDRLLELYEQGEREVVLELGGVSFIDSSGLGVLVAGLKRFGEAGGELRLRSPTHQLGKMLDMTGLSKVVVIER